jgi:glycyl-tRNA synthetase beta chain
MTDTKEFVVELGTEEIPARMMEDALDRLEEQFDEWLESHNLDHGEGTDFEVYGTPRRLVLTGTLPAKQADSTETIKGPPVDVAYDEDGEPTQALEGFCGQHDVDPDDVVEESENGGEYIFVHQENEGHPLEEVLETNLDLVFQNLSWPKLMRWGETDDHFIRPVRWLVALVGDELLDDLEVKGVSAGTESRGLRFTDDERVTVQSVEEYRTTFLESSEIIMLDQDQRREYIRERAGELAGEVGGDPVYDEDLLDEVTHLVEAPTPFRGEFEESFLKVPDPVLEETMQDHQWYFPVSDGDELLPYFIGVRNGGKQHLETVVDGNEKVLRARLNDAEFFYENDLETPFEQYREDLKGVVFQEELGSLHEKTERLADLVGEVYAGPQEDELLKAARHCKNDLVTDMVEEFPKLQGTMGKIYAQEAGWRAPVAALIEEHYYPKSSDGRLPGISDQDGVGAYECGLLALLDRLDTLVGFFAVGKRASGSGDPYGLRRDALGVLRILDSSAFAEYSMDLSDLLETVRKTFAEHTLEVADEDLADLEEFIRERFFNYIEDEYPGSYDVLQAVVPEYWEQPTVARERIEWIFDWQDRPDFEDLTTAYERANNLAGEDPPRGDVDPERFEDDVELRLHEELREHEENLRTALDEGDSEAVLDALVTLREPVDEFFETVMVMADDEDLRENRLKLLRNVRNTFNTVADFSAF